MLFRHTLEKARIFLPFLLGSLFFLYAGGYFYKMLADRNKQMLNFIPAQGAITNPLMGWAPWATIKEAQQPFTLVYADLTWRDFEPRQGVYDFASFEKKEQFERWRAENKRVVFRFVCDVPGSKKHMDIPDWLYQATDGAGDYYDNAYGKGYSPDYANPVFIKFHKAAIQALGEQYGKDSLFAYVELGSLGHWGEWHVNIDSGIRPLPDAEIRNQYVEQYATAFPNTLLLMRRPFQIAKQRNIGLYNDMTGSPAATGEWLGWITNGGEYDQTGEPDALVPMPDFWLTAPAGGEQTQDQVIEDLYGKHLAQTLDLLEKSHLTFIGPDSPYNVVRGEPLQSGVDQALERIGYRLYVKQVRMPFSVHTGDSLSFTITLGNDGVAPILYNWPVQIYLLDVNGDTVQKFQPEMDLRKAVPGKFYTTLVKLPLEPLNTGVYTIAFAIIDPKTQLPAVKLAMETTRNDFIQELGTFEVQAKSGWFFR